MSVALQNITKGKKDIYNQQWPHQSIRPSHPEPFDLGGKVAETHLKLRVCQDPSREENVCEAGNCHPHFSGFSQYLGPLSLCTCLQVSHSNFTFPAPTASYCLSPSSPRSPVQGSSPAMCSHYGVPSHVPYLRNTVSQITRMLWNSNDSVCDKLLPRLQRSNLEKSNPGMATCSCVKVWTLVPLSVLLCFSA